MKAIASYAFFSVLGAIFGPILVAAVTTVTSEPDTFLVLQWKLRGSCKHTASAFSI
jgi:hypothetical protein